MLSFASVISLRQRISKGNRPKRPNPWQNIGAISRSMTMRFMMADFCRQMGEFFCKFPIVSSIICKINSYNLVVRISQAIFPLIKKKHEKYVYIFMHFRQAERLTKYSTWTFNEAWGYPFREQFCFAVNVLVWPFINNISGSLASLWFKIWWFRQN